MNVEDFNITIVGLGLIGGSFALALRKLNPKKIWAVDIDVEALKKAEDAGIIDKGYKDGKIPLKQSDLVIVAIYPKYFLSFIEDNKDNFKKGAILTDVCGIKSGIVSNVLKIIPEYIDFIPGHPMAGREYKGLDYAKVDMFSNANYIIVPLENNKEENIKFIENMAYSIGCKNVSRLGIEQHDDIIAYVSHLPHILAFALINSRPNKRVYKLVGSSFRGATRVALINS
ncbi:MAG: prephenate dehydrogenase, partial [Clostridiaceae bacterium]